MTLSATQKNADLVNGVDVHALLDTIEAVKGDAELARFEFRATNAWISGGHNRSTIGSFYGCKSEDTARGKPFHLDADEPPILLGKDVGPNPVEYVLHALAGCLTTTIVYHAAARGIEIDAIDSSLKGDIDLRGFLGLSENVRKGYQTVLVLMRVKSNASPSLLRDLAKLSPVYDIVSNSLPVKVVVETY